MTQLAFLRNLFYIFAHVVFERPPSIREASLSIWGPFCFELKT